MKEFDKDLVDLVCTCLENRCIQADPFVALGELQNWVKRVQDAAEKMKVWIEESDGDDPRKNGWIGQDGRP